MSSRASHMQMFDAYLQHEMNEGERTAFEEKLMQDEAFRKEFEAHVKFIADIQAGGDYAEVRSLLRNIHDTPGVVRPPFFKSKQFYTGLSIAAGIALLIAVTGPFMQQGTESAESMNVQELTSAEESPSYSPAEATDSYALDSTNTVTEYVDDEFESTSSDLVPLIDKLPQGTAFLISEKGYFLTSRHLTENHTTVYLQQRDQAVTFEAEVVYENDSLDFAILRCHSLISAGFDPVPYQFSKAKIERGQDVFTLGYPKKEIVLTKGTIQSEKSYPSDSSSFEVSMTPAPGYLGAPLFTDNGDLIGMIQANNSKRQTVTYALKYHYMLETLQNLEKNGTLHVDMSSNFTKRYKEQTNLIKAYRPFIFELHTSAE